MGESGCCTCEEPGRTVKRGKGHTRCCPHREPKERFPLRDCNDIKYNLGPKATAGGGGGGGKGFINRYLGIKDSNPPPPPPPPTPSHSPPQSQSPHKFPTKKL